MRREPISHPLTIDVPDDVFANLSKLALQQGKPPEVLAQELVSKAIEELEEDPLLKWIGAFESNVPDAAERHDHYIGQALYRELCGDSEQPSTP
jgi:hypothetical protein